MEITNVETAAKRVKEVLPYGTVKYSLNTIVTLLLEGFEKELIEEGSTGLVSALSRTKAWENLKSVE
ncbi:unnamed protein product [marine sediment metagenome]|uniref:Uncharacterized protein n=1 Tax=marine sediment metagenome TaxID=412755 RepID=X0Y5Y2_9ZZZZ